MGDKYTSIFKTDFAMEIQNGRIIGGYSLRQGRSEFEAHLRDSCTFDSGDWQVFTDYPNDLMGRTTTAVYFLDKHGKRRKSRTLVGHNGWLYLGKRDGCRSVKFTPNQVLVRLSAIDFYDDLAPDGGYEFGFDPDNDDLAILVSDGEVDHEISSNPTEPLIRYSVTGATWVVYVLSQGRNDAPECTLVAEHPEIVEADLAAFLENYEYCNFYDVLDNWRVHLGCEA